ncbi:MAG: hypothetical protein L0Y71_01155 [Gemmataceae bacterium]|nr:hypothetical protein [Gemmataceae bacterium]
MNAPKPIRLTATLHRKIVSAIRAGGFPHISAQAFGVAVALLDEWLRRGDDRGGRFRAFARELRDACAQARLKAEIAVFNDDPPRWLEHGLGRDRPGNPGWAAAVRPLTLADERRVLDDAEFTRCMSEVKEFLAPFPEVVEKVNQLLAKDRRAQAA